MGKCTGKQNVTKDQVIVVEAKVAIDGDMHGQQQQKTPQQINGKNTSIMLKNFQNSLGYNVLSGCGISRRLATTDNSDILGLLYKDMDILDNKLFFGKIIYLADYKQKLERVS